LSRLSGATKKKMTRILDTPANNGMNSYSC